MCAYNLSDEIEFYIKKSFKSNNQIELSRQDIANYFQCVPSQINYVLKTRFTIEKGYIVDSKRGGGGYIRITKVDQCNIEQVDRLLIKVPNELTFDECKKIVQYLYELNIIKYKDSEMFLGLVSNDILFYNNSDEIRANMMKRWLEFVKYNWEE